MSKGAATTEPVRSYDFFNSGPTTATTVTTSIVASTDMRIKQRAGTVLRGAVSKTLRNAVYAHIRAMRTLGRTTITPEDISRALGISLSAALIALNSLEQKGVRRSR